MYAAISASPAAPGTRLGLTESIRTRSCSNVAIAECSSIVASPFHFDRIVSCRSGLYAIPRIRQLPSLSDNRDRTVRMTALPVHLDGPRTGHTGGVCGLYER